MFDGHNLLCAISTSLQVLRLHIEEHQALHRFCDLRAQCGLVEMFPRWTGELQTDAPATFEFDESSWLDLQVRILTFSLQLLAALPTLASHQSKLRA